jgi:hypothetical protein
MNAPTDIAFVKCRSCDKFSEFQKSTIQCEISRLRVANFEIINCPHCLQKYSIGDFEKALGVKDIINETGSTFYGPETFFNSEVDYSKFGITDPVRVEALEKARKDYNDKINKITEEKKKMQAGEPYDKKVVGNVDMEEGTPDDKKCVVFLKKEAELYAGVYKVFTFITNIIEIIGTFLLTFTIKIFEFVWDLIKLINWCIVCSILRMGYFVGYIVLVIYFIISMIINKPMFEPIFEFIYTYNLKHPSPNMTISDVTTVSFFWSITIVTIFTIPLILQIAWATNTPESRWAKVIKNHIDELIK